MKKIIVSVSILLFLFGCQSNNVSNENNLKQDAENIYSIIKNKELNKSSITENEHKQIQNFEDTYIKNYNNYKDQDLIMNMEKLINSYDFYYVSIGQKNYQSAKMYKSRLEEVAPILDKEFNK